MIRRYLKKLTLKKDLNSNFKILNIDIFTWSAEPLILAFMLLHYITIQDLFANYFVIEIGKYSCEHDRESIWKFNKTNEEDIIATIEIVEEKFEKLCSLNDETEELAEDAENHEKIYDGCLQSEAKITKKIKTVISLVDTEKGLIKNSDSKLESFKHKFVNLPKLTIEKFKGDYTKFNTFVDSFVATIDSCEDLKDIEKFNCLHGYLEGEAFCTIQAIKLTDNDDELLLWYGWPTKGD